MDGVGRDSEGLIAGLPGEDLFRAGLKDLKSGTESVPSLLLAIGRPRLRRLNLDPVFETAWVEDPEGRLYRLLGREHGNNAHSQYNAWLRRLIRFERGLERRVSRASGRSHAGTEETIEDG